MTEGADERDSDAALAHAALAGRQSAYAVLMRRHRDRVYRLARHHTGDDQDALDVTQETFVSAFAALHRFDPARPFRVWLLRIALNKCHDWARRRMVRKFLIDVRPLDDALHVADDRTPDPEQAALSRRAIARIDAAIARLPAKLKEPLILCRLEGMSHGEAAALLGTSEKAVETRLYRARKKLAEMLEG